MSENEVDPTVETIDLEDFKARWEEVHQDQHGNITRRRFEITLQKRSFRFRTAILISGILLLVILMIRPDLAGILAKEVSQTFRGLSP